MTLLVVFEGRHSDARGQGLMDLLVEHDVRHAIVDAWCDRRDTLELRLRREQWMMAVGEVVGNVHVVEYVRDCVVVVDVDDVFVVGEEEDDDHLR